MQKNVRHERVFSRPEDLSNRSVKVRDKHILHAKRESEGQRHT